MTPSKGDRRSMLIRMGRSLYAEIQEEARRQGKSMNELVVELLTASASLDEKPRCPHGEDPAECNACMVESDLAYDANRESPASGNPFLGR